MSARPVLLLLSLSAFYFIWYFSDANGLRALGDAAIQSKKLPGLDEPLRTHYTGLPLLDRLLAALTTFFWVTTDGSQPGLVLHSIAFSGTFSSAWVLVTLESWRSGNAWTIAAIPSVFGIMAQTLTFAVATPLYAYFHLKTAVTAARPTASNMRIPRAVLKALPHVFTVGMFVPSMLMIAPLSDTITHDMRQIFIAIWQPWPAYVATLLVVAKLVLGPFLSDRDTPADNAKARSSLRYVYAFAFANTTVSHLVSVVISLATVAAPQIFQPEFRDALHPLAVFDTPLPWASPVLKVATVGQGVQAFLRWDYLIGSTGVLVWAVSLYRSAHRAANADFGLCSLATKVAALSVLSSPVGAAVVLMWKREELFLRDAQKTKTGKK